MAKRIKTKNISNPDELNSYLESTKPITWIVLIAVTLSLAGFFLWACLTKITSKIKGTANISGGEVTLVTVQENRLSELKIGQKIYIANLEGEITGIKEDGYPIISSFSSLSDDNYDYYIVIKEIRPIEYFTNKQ